MAWKIYLFLCFFLLLHECICSIQYSYLLSPMWHEQYLRGRCPAIENKEKRLQTQGHQRESPSQMKEVSIPQSFIKFLGESNYRNWCGTNFYTTFHIDVQKSLLEDEQGIVWGKEVIHGCLKDILVYTALCSWTIAQPWTLVGMPHPWSWFLFFWCSLRLLPTEFDLCF